MRYRESVHVSLAHRYWDTRWDHARNVEIYGRFAGAEGRGGNWTCTLEVRISSEAAPDLKPYLEKIKQELDHRCLWDDLAEFRDRASTPEAVARHLTKLLPSNWTSLTIETSPRWACTVFSDGKMEVATRAHNLTLFVQRRFDEQTGLVGVPDEVERAVQVEWGSASENADESEWAEALFSRLKANVKGLERLRVDLGRQRFIVVSSGA